MSPALTSASLWTAAAFGLGAAVILLASLASKKIGRDLWPLYGSEFLIVGMLLVPAALGIRAFALFLLAVAVRGAWEWLALFRSGAKPRRAWQAGLILPAIFALMAGALRAGDEGFSWVFLCYATVEMADAFALLAGKLFGRRHPLPHLSPGKTVEGFVAGLAAGGIAGWLIARNLLHLPGAAALGIVAIALMAGLLGDLVTSAIKRAQGRKDFAPVLARHGGVLDIYDSFLFAAPALLALRALTGL